ncbi:uncharacterized protein METZ01_LOCUS423178, partial [marine metagenome]
MKLDSDNWMIEGYYSNLSIQIIHPD